MSDRGSDSPAQVVRCPSCRAAVDATLQQTCPFCGADLAGVEPTASHDHGPPETSDTSEVEETAPVTDEQTTPVEPEPVTPGGPTLVTRGRRTRSPRLGTRVVALVVGIGLLVGIALLQRFSGEPNRAAQTTRRGDVIAERASRGRAFAPVDGTPTPPPTAAPEAIGAGPPGRCAARTVDEVHRFYGFERERVGRWFDRLDRYNDHRLRLDGDSSGHARRDAAIASSRSHRFGALSGKRDAAEAACDLRLLL